MWVKVPPLRRLVTPYLPTVTRLGIREAEAGNRTQSVEIKADSNTGVNRETPRVKQVLEKCLMGKPQSE
ncbi:MAG: hypothetical protein AAGF83_22840 [Cyanobacteria bacterium P01_G01_bin.67]